MNRQQIMDFFRADDLLDNLSEQDLKEIALLCSSYSDGVYRLVSHAIELHEENIF